MKTCQEKNIPINYFVRLAIRILENYEKGDNGCWIWKRSCSNSGYGKLRIGHSKDYTVHRLSYYIFNGEIPEKMCVLHRCDNKKCINPEHLFLGTHKENSKDMVLKGRNISPLKFRTHCPKGHLHTGKVNINGGRICVICIRIRNREWDKKNRRVKK